MTDEYTELENRTRRHVDELLEAENEDNIKITRVVLKDPIKLGINDSVEIELNSNEE